MPKFLVQAKYTAEGVRGLKSEGATARVAVATEAIEGVGGRVEAFYFALGEFDAYLIVDYPDAVAAAATAMTVGAGGGVVVTTVALLTPEEIDAAAGRSATYRPPGS